jgi:2,3-bisphosphoglycerate-dependent phosphoglycerate mutase
MTYRRIAAFIRHADYQQLTDTPSALQPFALTQKGIAQSQRAVEEMKVFLHKNNWQLDATMNTSSLLRAWQTAQLFSEVLQDVATETMRIQCFDALTERSVGSAANLTINQIEQIIKDDPRFDALKPNWKSDSHFKLPFIGAESLLEAGQRVATHLIEQMSKMPLNATNQVKLFFGHGAAFRHAAYLLGVIDFEQIAALSMYHASPIYLEYAEDGKWCHIGGDWKVRAQHNEDTD